MAFDVTKPDLHCGQRMVYVKRGESEHYNTDWPATYLYSAPSGRCVIQIDGRKRKSVVRRASLIDMPKCKSCHGQGCEPHENSDGRQVRGPACENCGGSGEAVVPSIRYASAANDEQHP